MTNEHSIIKEVWETYEDEQWRQDQSHWRGVGRWKDDRKWQSIGISTLDKVRFTWSLLGRERLPSPLTCLEWGQGGGANLFALRPYCKTYYGVDISSKNLDEAKRMITQEGHADVFQPILLNDRPETITNSISEPLDLFISTAVFQHFPNQEYGFEVLRTIRKLSKSGTVGIVQIRFDSGDDRYGQIKDLSEYKAKHIVANAYKIEIFWTALKTIGFEPIMVRDIDTKVNYATFYFRVA